jgi:3-hydroxyacyl-CoA dehydrogenase/3a,7a,12a-trihydroxy-5b-cholest-24-enoyl-CoA hydratase
LNYGLDRLLHGEQYVELMRPLPLSATLTTKGTVKDIWDKGKGALVVTAFDSYDEEGDLLIKSEMTAFVRGAGGWGGDRGPNADINVPPDRQPDFVVEDAIPANQALLYRLSGDWNPLHADPEMAQAFGFARPILHGLCTFGYAGRRVLEKFAPQGNPDFFQSIKVRFADNVYPGDTLITEMWKESDQRIVFQCKVKERDALVISNAALELFEEIPKPKEKKETGAKTTPTGPVEPTAADVITAANQFLADHPDIAQKAQAVFQLKLKNPDSLWTIDLKAGAARAGAADTPDATLELAEADYLSLQKGEADPIKLFSTGKLKVTGDMMSVNKLEGLLKMPFDLVVSCAEARGAEKGEAEARVRGGALAAAPASAPEVYEPLAPKLFDALADRLNEQPSLADEVGAVLQFYVRDPDSKWVLDLKNQPPALKSGETDGANTTITIADADLAALSSGEATPQMLFQRGKLRVDGELEPAHRLNFLKGLI